MQILRKIENGDVSKVVPKDGRKIVAFVEGYMGSEIRWDETFGAWLRITRDETGIYMNKFDQSNWPITHVMFEVSEEEGEESWFTENGLTFAFDM